MGEVNDSEGTPSTTHRGSLPLRVLSIDKLLNPRIVIDVPPPPGAPVMFVTFIPATRPCNKFAIEGDGISLISEALTVDIAPITSLLFCVP